MDQSPPITIRSESPDGKQVAPGPSDSSRRKLSHCFRCLHLIAKFGNSKRIRCGAIPSTRTRVLASCNYCRKTRQTCGMILDCYHDISSELIKEYDAFWALPESQRTFSKDALNGAIDSFRKLVPAVSILDLRQREIRRAERQHRHGEAMEGGNTQDIISEGITTSTVDLEPLRKISKLAQEQDTSATLESIARLMVKNTSVLQDVLARLTEHQRPEQDWIAPTQPSSNEKLYFHPRPATDQLPSVAMQHTDHASVNSFPSQKLQQRGTKGPSTYCRTTSYAPNPKCLLTHDTRAHTMSSTASHQKAVHCPSSVPSIARNTAKLRYSFLKGQKNTWHDANTRSLMQNTLHLQSSTLQVFGTQPTAFIVPQKGPLPPQRAFECSSSTERSVCSTTEGPPVVSRASETFTTFPFLKHQDGPLNKGHSVVTSGYPITLPAIKNVPTSASKDSFTLPSLQNLLIHSSPPPTPTTRLGKQSMSFIPKLLVPPVTVPRPQSPSVPPWSLIPVHQDPQCSDQAFLTLPTPQHYFPTTSQNPQATDEPSVSQRPKLMNKRPFRSSDSIIAAQDVLPLTSKRMRRSTSCAIASGKVVSPTPKRLSRSVSRRTGGQRQPLDCIQVVHHKEVSVPVPRRLSRSVVSSS